MSAAKILDSVRLIQKCIILSKNGEILALRRAADDHSRGGNWDLPGGGYELGENVDGAIIREVFEEAGITANNPIPFFVTNHMNVKKGFFAGLNVFGICYYCTDWTGEVALSEEHTEYKWCTPNEFARLSFGEDNGFFGEALAQYLTILSYTKK